MGRIRRDHAKLVDFGIAKPSQRWSRPVTRSGFTVGTPEYMSPEQVRGLEITTLSDVWSMGAVMHEALTRSPPFAGLAPKDIMFAILTNERPTVASKRADLPEWLGRIVDRALERAPEDRWRSAATMRDALCAWVESGRGSE